MIRSSVDLPVSTNKTQEAAQAVSISTVKAGQEVVLVRVDGGGLGHRLAEMGLVPGSALRIMAKGRPGPIIVALGTSRMVLGRGLVHRIWVRPR